MLWYHTIELPGGVVTPGYYDLRTAAERVPLPKSLAGKRCLDAASCDGFWSFQMASRGADQVVSLDLPDPALQDWQGTLDEEARRTDIGRSRRCFDLAREQLGYDNIERRDMSIYDITPDELGTFDFVFVGSVLLHLADPVRALRSLRSVTKDELLSFEHVNLTLSLVTPGFPVASLSKQDEARWWTPNRAAHRRWVRSAGFEVVDSGGPIFQHFGDFFPRRPKMPHNWRELFWWGGMRYIGAASQWVRARP